MNSSSVSVAKIAELLDLKNFTDEIDLKKRKITTTDINRPALQLTGYFEHFEESRVEIIGNVEYAYIQQMSDEEKRIRYDAFLKFDIPCVIFSRNLTPDPIFLKEKRLSLPGWMRRSGFCGGSSRGNWKFSGQEPASSTAMPRESARTGRPGSFRQG